jgi:hypothetical protein
MRCGCQGAAGRVLEGIRATERVVDRSTNGWRKQILWVNDRPDNNAYERRAFESMGIEFTLAGGSTLQCLVFECAGSIPHRLVCSPPGRSL